MGIIIILMVTILCVYNTKVNPISFLWVKVLHASSLQWIGFQVTKEQISRAQKAFKCFCFT